MPLSRRVRDTAPLRSRTDASPTVAGTARATPGNGAVGRPDPCVRCAKADPAVGSVTVTAWAKDAPAGAGTGAHQSRTAGRVTQWAPHLLRAITVRTAC